jgi:adenylate cyclase
VQDSGAWDAYTQDLERDIVVMFADIRGFTQISEQRLPDDEVFILNPNFAEMAIEIEGASKRTDKFIGDGIMVLFAVDASYPDGCRHALLVANAVAENLKSLHEKPKNALDEPLRIGIGIHGGPAIVGELGYRWTRSLAVVDDTVNTVSRS